MLPSWGIKPKRGIMEETESPRGEKRKDSPEKPRCQLCPLGQQEVSGLTRMSAGKTELISFRKLAPTEKLNWEKCESAFEGCELFLPDIKTNNNNNKKETSPTPSGWPTSTWPLIVASTIITCLFASWRALLPPAQQGTWARVLKAGKGRTETNQLTARQPLRTDIQAGKSPCPLFLPRSETCHPTFTNDGRKKWEKYPSSIPQMSEPSILSFFFIKMYFYFIKQKTKRNILKCQLDHRNTIHSHFDLRDERKHKKQWREETWLSLRTEWAVLLHKPLQSTTYLLKLSTFDKKLRNLLFTCFQFFATPWTAACQSFTISRSLLKLMSVESVMPSNHLVLC